jgi:hypothetical protein
LPTAKIIVTKGGEIGVICRPIDCASHGGHGDEPRQIYTDAVNFSQKRIRQGAQHRADDHHRPQVPAGGKNDDDRANDKAPQQDQRERYKYARQRNAGFQQIDRKERTTAAFRNPMDSIMQIKKVDTAVAKERHRQCPLRGEWKKSTSTQSDQTAVVARLAASERQLRSVDHPHRRDIPSRETALSRGGSRGGPSDVQYRQQHRRFDHLAQDRRK